MKTRAELKAESKQLMANYSILYVVAAIGVIGTLILSFIPIIGSLSSFLMLAVQFLLLRTGIQLGKGQELNSSFYTDTTGLLRCVKSYLWTIVYLLPYILMVSIGTGVAIMGAFNENTFLLLTAVLIIVAGYVLFIVKEFSYCMAIYIALDDRYDHLTAKETIKISEEMMQGHKVECFILGLSFFGWILVGSITFSLGMIYVMPYQCLTFANYYLEIEKNYKYKN